METAVLGQSLARTLLEPDFRLSRLAAIGFPLWDQGETPVFSHILARSLLEPACGTFAACGPATKRAFWDQGETAVFSQILAEAFWTQLLRLSRLAGRQLKVPSGLKGKRPF